MAQLSDNIKRFIVQALACFDTPQQVAEAVNQEFGIRVARQQVAKYDPTKASGAKLSKKWNDLFRTTRASFREKGADVPVALQPYRLRVLQRLLERSEARGATVLVLKILEQAAKEVGGAYEQRAKLGEDDMPPAIGFVRGVADARVGVLRPDEPTPSKIVLDDGYVMQSDIVAMGETLAALKAQNEELQAQNTALRAGRATVRKG